MSKPTARHTKGPFRVFRNDRQWHNSWIIDSDTRKYMAILEVPHVAEKWGKEHPESVREFKRTVKEVAANAQLMASSPSLLAAIQRLRRTPNSKAAQAQADAAILEALTVRVR